MIYTRRDFLKTGSLAVAGMGASRHLITDFTRPLSQTSMFPDDDPAAIRELAAAALQAAKDGGATYADVRLTRDRRFWTSVQKTKVLEAVDTNDVQVGIRVLLNNVWGFSALATRDKDEVAAVARRALDQAKVNAWGNRPAVELVAAPKVENGSWTTPMKEDPRNVTMEEIINYMREGHAEAMKIKEISWARSKFTFRQMDETVATSEGSYFTQRFHYAYHPSSYSYASAVRDGAKQPDTQLGMSDHVWCQGAGYEAVRSVNYKEAMRKNAEDAVARLNSPPVEPGSYDVVLDGKAMADVLASTLGAHTEIDRALGYEANASGTSWVAPPMDVLGKLRIGSPMITVKCDRSHPLSPANVKWDCEGVEPEEFTVVDKGMLVDYQTTREQVTWMKDYYKSSGRPMRSHGCSRAVDASFLPMQLQANAILMPGSQDTKAEDMFSGIKRGMFFKGGFSDTDQQGLTGQCGSWGMAYEIRNGKIEKLVRDAALQFRTQELFKNVVAIGGQSSFVFKGANVYKGEPLQIYNTAAGAPAFRIRDGKVRNTGSGNV
jgi:TldD protein